MNVVDKSNLFSKSLIQIILLSLLIDVEDTKKFIYFFRQQAKISGDLVKYNNQFNFRPYRIIFAFLK
jgi:hypothetical protein